MLIPITMLSNQSLEVNMSDSTIFSQMHIQSILVVSSFHSEKPPREYQPIRLVILRHHTAMLNDPMLLRQVLLCEALNVDQFTTATTSHTSDQKRTVVSEVLSVSFFPTSLFIQSSCWLLLLEPLEPMRPGTTRGMVALRKSTWKGDVCFLILF